MRLHEHIQAGRALAQAENGVKATRVMVEEVFSKRCADRLRRASAHLVTVTSDLEDMMFRDHRGAIRAGGDGMGRAMLEIYYPSEEVTTPVLPDSLALLQGLEERLRRNHETADAAAALKRISQVIGLIERFRDGTVSRKPRKGVSPPRIQKAMRLIDG